MFTGLQNNTLSRSKLNYESGTVKNVHYGDVLIKFGDYIDASKEELPFINDDSKVEKFKGSFLHNGDIIIADTAEDETVGKCTEIQGVDDIKLISGLHTIPCRPKEEYGAKFLGYYMNSSAYRAQLIPLMQGIKVTSISKSALQDTDMIIPKSVDEQTIIGEYFSNLDNLITLHQRKSFFKTFKIIVWEQRKVWELVKEGVLDAPLDGNHGEKHPTSNEYVDEGIPFLMASDVHDGDVDIKSCKFITKERAEQLDKGFARNGDVLLTHKASIGETAILNGLTTEYAMLTPQVTYYRIQNEERLNRKYLYAFFNSLDFQNDLKTKAAQSTRPYIGITAQQNLNIVLPKDVREQERIGTYFYNLDNLITLHRRAYHHHKRRTYK